MIHGIHCPRSHKLPEIVHALYAVGIGLGPGERRREEKSAKDEHRHDDN